MTLPLAGQAGRLLKDATPLVSSDVGNALTVGADKKLKMLPGTPSAHASTHNAGGSDALALAGAATATAAGTAGLVNYAADNAAANVRNQAATPASVAANLSAATFSATQITSGVFDIARIPATAIATVVTVANNAAKLALTITQVQLGDTVKMTDTTPPTLWLVVDDTKLGTEAAFQQFSASVDWASITNKPTSFAPSAHAASHNAGGADALAAGTAATATANGSVGVGHAAAGNAPDTDWQGWATPAFVATKNVRTTASTTLTAALAANTPFTVPTYPMGANKIVVFLNSAYCNQGATNIFAYKEASTTTITFYDALVVGDVIDVIVLK